MTTTVLTTASRWGWVVRDGWEMTRRTLLHTVRIPYTIVAAVLQPIIFALLFRYVFGAAFAVPGDYVDFLIPGMLAMAAAFGSIGTAIWLAIDLETRTVDRFRSLPMARSAVLVGHTTASLLLSVLSLLAMLAMGFVIGFDVDTSWAALLAAVGLVLALSYALIWVFALVGVLAPNAMTAEVIAFPALFPLTFASSAFVPTNTMPGWLQVFSEHQPVTAVVDASRALILGGPADPVLTALAWIVGTLAVVIPLTIHRYRRAD